MTVYMQIQGVEGESQVPAAGWFTLTRFTWGGRRAARTHAGGVFGTATTYSTPQLRAITVSRQSDSATAQLWDHMMQAKPVPVRFKWMRPGPGGAPTSYLEAEFDEALIVAIDVDSNAAGHPLEKLTITYRALEFRVINVGNALAGAQDVVSFNLGAA